MSTWLKIDWLASLAGCSRNAQRPTERCLDMEDESSVRLGSSDSWPRRGSGLVPLTYCTRSQAEVTSGQYIVQVHRLRFKLYGVRSRQTHRQDVPNSRYLCLQPRTLVLYSLKWTVAADPIVISLSLSLLQSPTPPPEFDGVASVSGFEQINDTRPSLGSQGVCVVHS